MYAIRVHYLTHLWYPFEVILSRVNQNFVCTLWGFVSILSTFEAKNKQNLWQNKNYAKLASKKMVFKLSISLSKPLTSINVFLKPIHVTLISFGFFDKNTYSSDSRAVVSVGASAAFFGENVFFFCCDGAFDRYF